MVAKKVQESDEITSFYLKPKDCTPLEPYRPGQYIFVQKLVSGFGVYRSKQ